MKHVVCAMFFYGYGIARTVSEFPKNSTVKSQEGSIEEAFR